MQRRLSEADKNRTKSATKINLSTKPYLSNEDHLYPNCDLYIWLRSCTHEVNTPIVGSTSGEIPTWLRGSLYRNGPGYIEYENQTVNHIFDGAGLLHRFGLRNGCVTYQNQLTKSKSYLRNSSQQRVTINEFATPAALDPCKTIFHKVSSLFTELDEVFSDNPMISVYPIGNELFAFAETPFAFQFDPVTLKTIGRANLYNDVGFTSHSSHPHVMPDGTVFHLGQQIDLKGPGYSILKIPRKKEKETINSRSKVDYDSCDTELSAYETDSTSGVSDGEEETRSVSPSLSDRSFISTDSNENTKRQVSEKQVIDLKEKSPFRRGEIIVKVPCRWKTQPSYMHSFSVTDNYFILVEQPLAAPLAQVFRNVMKGRPLVDALVFNEDESTIFRVISRATGQEIPVRYSTETFFFLHTINAYEEDGHIVIDICCYKNPRMLECMYIEALKNGQSDEDYAKLFRGRPKRFVIPINPPTNKPGNLNTLSYSHSIASWYRNGKEIYINPEIIADIGCETPRINYDVYNSKKYRYFYAISSDVDMDNPGTLIKVDINETNYKTWCEKDIFPSEPVFVPRPDAIDEDDGVILSSLIFARGETNKVGLLILDAKTWTEISRTVFVTPGPIPKCLHGWYASNTQNSDAFT
ncbi:carotenoid isomerooxygenase-like [Artemia franciscana]|uniref:carotenoid isomerooxygenase-like n=1 Tax=Artemia franciscana TaxID=6661 RepID=UPI0032DB93CA